VGRAGGISVRRIRLWALLLLVVLPISGCWSRIELNDLGVVLALGLDVGEEEAVRLTVLIPAPSAPGQSGGGGGAGGGGSGAASPVWVAVREAPSVSDAMQMLQQAAPRRLVRHHMRVVLISEEYARTHGVGDILDALANDLQARMTVRPFIVEGRAEDLLENQPPLRPYQPMHLTGILQAAGGVEWRLKDILVGRVSETHSTWMHAVKLVTRPAGAPGGFLLGSVISGAALMRGDSLVRILHPPESQVFEWFFGIPKEMIMSAPCPKGEAGTFSGHVLQAKMVTQPLVEGGQVKFRVTVTVHMNMSRSECNVEVRRRSDRTRLEEAMAAELRGQFEKVIAAMQEAGVDPVGFGKRLQLAYPAYFRGIRDRWSEVWPTAPVEVETKVTIRQAGLMKAPAIRTDRELQEWR